MQCPSPLTALPKPHNGLPGPGTLPPGPPTPSTGPQPFRPVVRNALPRPRITLPIPRSALPRPRTALARHPRHLFVPLQQPQRLHPAFGAVRHLHPQSQHVDVTLSSGCPQACALGTSDVLQGGGGQGGGGQEGKSKEDGKRKEDGPEERECVRLACYRLKRLVCCGRLFACPTLYHAW